MRTLFQNPATDALMQGAFKVAGNKVFIRLKNRICESSDELFTSDLCYEITKRCVVELEKRKSS
jgi:hypothetical protein